MEDEKSLALAHGGFSRYNAPVAGVAEWQTHGT